MPRSVWPPLPCSRQVGRQTDTLELALGILPRMFGASTETVQQGAERPGDYPMAPCKDMRRVWQGCRLGYN